MTTRASSFEDQQLLRTLCSKVSPAPGAQHNTGGSLLLLERLAGQADVSKGHEMTHSLSSSRGRSNQFQKPISMLQQASIWPTVL